MINTVKKEEYITPGVDIIHLQVEACICQSPGGGGSEGTGDEELIPRLFDGDVIDPLLL